MWQVLLLITCLLPMNELPVEDGQSVLMDRLPAWERVIRNKDTFGCIRYECLVGGKPFSEVMINTDGEFRISEESMKDGSSQSVGFSNESYNADVEIRDKKPQLLSVSKNDDSYWRYHFLMTSFHGDYTFPELIRKKKMVVSGYSIVDGKHRFAFDRNDDDDFVKTELVFGDGCDLPIEMTNWFSNPKGQGQKIVFNRFVKVGQTSLPVDIDFEDLIGQQNAGGKILAKYTIEPLEKEKCYLEYYGLARPGYEVATNEEKSFAWIYVVGSIAFILISGIALRGMAR